MPSNSAKPAANNRALRSADPSSPAIPARPRRLYAVSQLLPAARPRPRLSRRSGPAAKMVAVLANKAGIPLSTGGERADDEKVQNRQSGLGALFGYVTGLGVGTAYELLHPLLRGLPMPVAGVGVDLAAMATSDFPIAALGVSDPTTWGVSSWAADVVPHLAYGLVTAIAYDAFTDR